MCLIIAPGKDNKPALLPRDVFNFAYRRNNDGFGAMWTEEGRVKHFKTLGLTEEETYLIMEEYTERYPNVVFHLRYKTHGKIISGLSHPFRVLHKSRHGKDLFFMHNGVLGGFGNDLTPGQSDTTKFKDKILIPLLTRRPDALDDPEVFASLEKLTNGSRLIFMDSDGKVWNTHEKTWNDRYGLTLSNTYMLPSYTQPATVYTLVEPKTAVTGGFVNFRRIESKGQSQGFWCACPKSGFVRTEGGRLYKDGGATLTIYEELDYIKPEDEAKYLIPLVAAPTLEYDQVTYVDVDDDVPWGDEAPKDNEVVAESGPAPIEQRLRYARLVHNLYAGTVTSREQLIGDLVGMGEKELGEFVSEDPSSAHTVVAELVEMVLEYNDALWTKDPANDKVLDADRLLEVADVKYHQQAMKDITALRQLEYKARVNEKTDDTPTQRMEQADKKAWSRPVSDKEAA